MYTVHDNSIKGITVVQKYFLKIDDVKGIVVILFYFYFCIVTLALLISGKCFHTPSMTLSRPVYSNYSKNICTQFMIWNMFNAKMAIYGVL